MSTYIHLSTNLVQYEDSVVILFHELRRDTSIARRCQQLFQSAERVGGHIEVGQRHEFVEEAIQQLRAVQYIQCQSVIADTLPEH